MLHGRPSIIDDDINGFEDFASVKIHLCGSARIVDTLGPISALLENGHLIDVTARAVEVILRLIEEPQVGEEGDGLVAASALAEEPRRLVELALPRQDVADEDVGVRHPHPLLVGDGFHQVQVFEILDALERLVGDLQLQRVQRFVAQLRPIRFRHAHPRYFVRLSAMNESVNAASQSKRPAQLSFYYRNNLRSKYWNIGADSGTWMVVMLYPCRQKIFAP